MQEVGGQHPPSFAEVVESPSIVSTPKRKRAHLRNTSPGNPCTPSRGAANGGGLIDVVDSLPQADCEGIPGGGATDAAAMVPEKHPKPVLLVPPSPMAKDVMASQTSQNDCAANPTSQGGGLQAKKRLRSATGTKRRQSTPRSRRRGFPSPSVSKKRQSVVIVSPSDGLKSSSKLLPSFRASELAALIGLHCYEKAVDALVRCWGRLHRPSLNRWQKLTGGVRLPEVTFARHASSRVRAVINAASRAGDGAIPTSATEGIIAAVEATAPRALWQSLKDEALGRVRKARGVRLEGTGLDAYESMSGRCVTCRNQESLRKSYYDNAADGSISFSVAGRTDGWEEVDGVSWVVEHKRRQKRLMADIPDYENIQCQAYMNMADVPACRWVQTLGTQVDSRAIFRCSKRWACVEARLNAMAKLLRQLCTGSLCPAPGELEHLQSLSWEAAPSWPDAATDSSTSAAETTPRKLPNEEFLMEVAESDPADRVEVVVTTTLFEVEETAVEVGREIRQSESQVAPTCMDTACTPHSQSDVRASASLQETLLQTTPNNLRSAEVEATLLDESEGIGSQVHMHCGAGADRIIKTSDLTVTTFLDSTLHEKMSTWGKVGTIGECMGDGSPAPATEIDESESEDL
jgi:hypothetical protein